VEDSCLLSTVISPSLMMIVPIGMLLFAVVVVCTYRVSLNSRAERMNAVVIAVQKAMQCVCCPDIVGGGRM